MKRGRYQHQANILCQMFRGWQLIPDYRSLTDLGSGKIEFDLLNGSCRHNARPVTNLGILEVLRSFLNEDLERHGELLQNLGEASLIVEYELEEYEGQKDKKARWANPARIFVGCHLSMNSRLSANGTLFTCALADTIEWPKNWAA